MCRTSLARLALCLALVTAGSARAIPIDTFETGSFSLSRSTPGTSSADQSPDPAHCIASTRHVLVSLYQNSTGVMSSALTPLQNVDDAIVTTFPTGPGELVLAYSGGPWDLTSGGTLNRLSVRATVEGPAAYMNINLFDDTNTEGTATAYLTATGTYNFSLASFGNDVTSIKTIQIYVWGEDGAVIGLRDVSTSSGSSVTLIYDVHTPSTYTWLCQPRGASSLRWDWALGSPAAPAFAGPDLLVTGVSGANCQGVLFDAYDSGGGGGQFGEVGLVNVEWQAPTFDFAAFEMRFVLDPTESYDTQLVGTPEVTVHETSFAISHDVQVYDVPGIPDGVVHQDLVVAAAPGQELTFDYVDALPLAIVGGAGVGYSLSFGITGAVVDTGLPLLEIYTTGSYADDAGMTGVAIGSDEPRGEALMAHPSVTRSGTRFVIPGDVRGPKVIEVFDVTGRKVRQLTAENGEGTWNATDSHGARVPAGVYFGRVAGTSGSARVVLIR